MPPARDEVLKRGGIQFILNISAVIFVGLAVVLGLSLLLFPPTSALFLGTAIAAGVCAAISLTCVGLARREKAKANQLRGREYDRQRTGVLAGGREATRSSGMRESTRDGPVDGARRSSAAGKNESKLGTSRRSAGPGGGGGGGRKN